MAELTKEIFVKDIPSNRAKDKEYCELYMEDVSGGVVTDVKFLWDGLRASVSFEEKIDFRKTEEKVSNRPYSGHQVSISIPQPIDTILIEGIPVGIHDDDVTLHFENPRYGGSDIKDYYMMPHLNAAVIQYESPEVVDSVLSYHNHIIFGKEMRVRKYNRNIEPFPPAIPRSEADGSHEDNFRGKHAGNASHDMKNNAGTSQSNFPDDNKHEKEHFQSDDAKAFDRGAGLPSGAKAVPINDGVIEHQQIYTSKEELKLALVNSGSARPSANMPGYAKKPPGTYGIRSEDEEAMENEKSDIQIMDWQPIGGGMTDKPYEPSHYSHDGAGDGTPYPHRVASDPLGAEGGTSRSSDNGGHDDQQHASGSGGGSFPANQSKSSSENQMRVSKGSNSYNEGRKTEEDTDKHDNFGNEPSRTRSGKNYSPGNPESKTYADVVGENNSGRGSSPYKLILKKGVWRMLKIHMYFEVQDACEMERFQRVRYDFFTDNRTEWSIKFEGKDAAKAKANVEMLRQRILYKTFSKTKPGLYCIFSHNGIPIYWLSNIETKHKCCIEVRRFTGPATGTGKHQHARSQISTNQSKMFQMDLKTSIGKMQVMIMKGDIVNLPEKVDVLVNPVVKGNSLDKGGAIAKAFLKKGGQDLQKAIDKKGGIRFDNEVVHTYSTGSINSKIIYHLRYETWGFNTEKTLTSVVKYCLDEANKHKNKSIAFPTIGCGQMKYPVSKVAEILHKEITKYDNKHSSSHLKDVYIVAFDDKIYEEFCAEFTSHFGTSPGSQKNSASRSEKKAYGARQDTDSDSGPPQQPLETTVFHINGLSDASIEAAIRDLEYKISEEYLQIDFTISNLNQRDRDEIQGKQSKNVVLHIDEKNKKVIISGKKSEVKYVHGSLSSYFNY